MATIIKRNGKYRVQVRLKGTSYSATFERRSDAKEWAMRLEMEIINGKKGRNNQENICFGDLLLRYSQTMTIKKRGAHQESYRINRMRQDDLAKITINNLCAQDFANWRDMRLTQVSNDTVNRELGILSAVCEHAMKEWGLLTVNPVRNISKPKNAKARTRRPSEEEIIQICEYLDYSVNELIISDGQKTAVAFLFAIETAMRAGEICALTWENICFERKIAHIAQSKNGYSRDVPLSSRALALLRQMQPLTTNRVFGLTSKKLSYLFRHACLACGIVDLHFHDTRREALTRLSKKVPVEILAKISGHRSLNILLNVYYHPDMQEIAVLLD